MPACHLLKKAGRGEGSKLNSDPRDALETPERQRSRPEIQAGIKGDPRERQQTVYSRRGPPLLAQIFFQTRRSRISRGTRVPAPRSHVQKKPPRASFPGLPGHAKPGSGWAWPSLRKEEEDRGLAVRPANRLARAPAPEGETPLFSFPCCNKNPRKRTFRLHLERWRPLTLASRAPPPKIF